MYGLRKQIADKADYFKQIERAQTKDVKKHNI
jgi:hypothetical protein